MLQRFYAIAVNAFVETIRQPIYGVILLATAVLFILNVSLAAFTLDDDDKLLLDLGLSTLLMSGLFLSAFSAAGILSREIENKTVLTVPLSAIPSLPPLAWPPAGEASLYRMQIGLGTQKGGGTTGAGGADVRWAA